MLAFGLPGDSPFSETEPKWLSYPPWRIQKDWTQDFGTTTTEAVSFVASQLSSKTSATNSGVVRPDFLIALATIG